VEPDALSGRGGSTASGIGSTSGVRAGLCRDSRRERLDSRVGLGCRQERDDVEVDEIEEPDAVSGSGAGSDELDVAAEPQDPVESVAESASHAANCLAEAESQAGASLSIAHGITKSTDSDSPDAG
jgi:hypothetical protein